MPGPKPGALPAWRPPSKALCATFDPRSRRLQSRRFIVLQGTAPAAKTSFSPNSENRKTRHEIIGGHFYCQSRMSRKSTCDSGSMESRAKPEIMWWPPGCLIERPSSVSEVATIASSRSIARPGFDRRRGRRPLAPRKWRKLRCRCRSSRRIARSNS